MDNTDDDRFDLFKQRDSNSKAKMTKISMIQELDDFKLSLRKKKLFDLMMKRRKIELVSPSSPSSHNPFVIALSDIEQYIPNDILQMQFSYESIRSILLMTNDINLLKYALAKIQLHCALEQYLVPKEILLALGKCLLNEYQPIDQQYIIQYNIISILINVTARNDSDASFLFDKVLIIQLHLIITNQMTPLDIKYDTVWLIDNLIKSSSHLQEISNAINIIETLEQVYSNQINDHHMIILLHCIDNVIQFNDKKQLLFKGIIEDAIAIFISKWREYSNGNDNNSSSSNSNDNNNNSKGITSKLLKRILSLLSNVFNKSKKYIHIVNTSKNAKQFIASITDILSKYSLPMKDDDGHNDSSNRTTIRVSESSITMIKAKDKEPFESKPNTLTGILIIIGSMLYSETEETYAIFVNSNLINIIQHVLDQLILHCSLSNKHFNKIDSAVYYIAWLSNNFAYQSLDYAKMLFFNSAVVSSLLRLNDLTQLSSDSKKELILIFYNTFTKNDMGLNYFFLNSTKTTNFNSKLNLLEFLIQTLKNEKKNNSLLSLIIDFFSLIFQYYDNTKNKMGKSELIKTLQANDVPSLLNKLQLSDNIEVSELATLFLSELTMDINEDIIDDIINVDLDGEESEDDYDY